MNKHQVSSSKGTPEQLNPNTAGCNESPSEAHVGHVIFFKAGSQWRSLYLSLSCRNCRLWIYVENNKMWNNLPSSRYRPSWEGGYYWLSTSVQKWWQSHISYSLIFSPAADLKQIWIQHWLWGSSDDLLI